MAKLQRLFCGFHVLLFRVFRSVSPKASESDRKLQWTEPEPEVADIQSRYLAAAYENQELWKEAETIRLENLQILEETLGEKHVDTLREISHLAFNYFSQGRLEEADSLYLQVLPTWESHFGKAHRKTLGVLRCLSYVYRKQGRLEESEELAHQVLSVQQRILGEEHPETLDSMHNLACVYVKQGRLQEAELLDLKASSTSKRVFGEEYSGTHESLHNLACTYRKQRRLGKAETLELQVLSARNRVLGEGHPKTLKSMYNLTRTYHDRGRLQEAERLGLRVLRRRKRTLGADHTDTLHSMQNLACIYLEQDRLHEAEALALQVLSMRKSISGAKHSYTLSVIRSLARIHEKQNQLKEAEVLPQKLPSIQEIVSQYPQRQDLTLGAAEPEYPGTIHLAPPSNIDEDNESELSELQDANAAQPSISTTTSIEDAFRYLVDHGCSDFTTSLDLCQYPLTAPLAGGNFGDVWRGKLKDQTRVAIKCLRLHTTTESSKKIVKRAARELYNWSKASHENVLELMGVALFRGQLAMVWLWMESGTLYAYICKNPNVDRWALCVQVAKGLAYIHEIEMVHGDLKATNILMSDEGVVKLSDFGNSILSNASLVFTPTSHIGGGTARWMAPELLVDNAIDRSMPADVYAFGMTVLEVMTGRLPYFGKKEPAVTLAVTQGVHPERPGELSRDTYFGDERWGLLCKCWQDGSRRPYAGEIRDVFPFWKRPGDVEPGVAWVVRSHLSRLNETAGCIPATALDSMFTIYSISCLGLSLYKPWDPVEGSWMSQRQMSPVLNRNINKDWILRAEDWIEQVQKHLV